jgi:hypothetical protein
MQNPSLRDLRAEARQTALAAGCRWFKQFLATLSEDQRMISAMPRAVLLRLIAEGATADNPAAATCRCQACLQGQPGKTTG